MPLGLTNSYVDNYRREVWDTGETDPDTGDKVMRPQHGLADKQHVPQLQAYLIASYDTILAWEARGLPADFVTKCNAALSGRSTSPDKARHKAEGQVLNCVTYLEPGDRVINPATGLFDLDEYYVAPLEEAVVNLPKRGYLRVVKDDILRARQERFDG